MIDRYQVLIVLKNCCCGPMYLKTNYLKLVWGYFFQFSLVLLVLCVAFVNLMFVLLLLLLLSAYLWCDMMCRII